jgi:hypothetical protein
MRNVLATLLLLVTTGEAAARREVAFFVFDVPPAPEEFVIKLTDPERIAQARRILAGEELPLQVMGRVQRRRAAYNSPWHVRLAPRTIEFFEFAVEVCDAAIAYVEEHRREIGGAFLPGRIWCPWGSRLVREIPRPARPPARAFSLVSP